jgi:signal transduction histidine kinase
MGLTRSVLNRNLWWGGAGLGAVLLACGGFIWALREKLRRQRTEAGARSLREQAMRELNASLEQRVTERTTELEQARADLAAALQEEREVGELKSRFVSTVSHEFRTPLGVIMSATDILSRYRDRLAPERQDEHLAEIRQATRHMSGMMEDILLLGRAESGRIAITPQPCDLVELLHRLADETRSAAHQTGQTRITAAPLPGPAGIDEMLLRHMFSNLLSNAVKYSPDGAEIAVHVRADGPSAVISITDSGIGIPPEDARKLFQPFTRAGNVGERPGSGLGLVIVKRCAELHGGTVTFTSTPGAGTTFILSFPAWTA